MHPYFQVQLWMSCFMFYLIFACLVFYDCAAYVLLNQPHRCHKSINMIWFDAHTQWDSCCPVVASISDENCYLRQEGDVCLSVCLSVCQSVCLSNRIIPKLLPKSLWNFTEWLDIIQGSIDQIFEWPWLKVKVTSGQKVKNRSLLIICSKLS